MGIELWTSSKILLALAFPQLRSPLTSASTLTGTRQDLEGSEARRVKGMKSDGSASWTYPANGALNAYANVLAIGDVDGDSKLDLVFVTEDLEIHIINIDPTSQDLGEDVTWWDEGGKKLTSDLYPNGFTGVALGNIVDDWDGLEVVVSTPTEAFVFLNDGSVWAQWSRNNVLVENWVATPLIADVDDDGDMDVLLPNGHHQIEAWDGNTGELLTHWPVAVNDRITDYALKEVDSDSDLELVVVTEGGLVDIFDLGSTGSAEWGEVNHDAWHSNQFGFTPPAAPGAGAFHPYGLWTDAENAYVLAGDLIIDNGKTLTLDPGVELAFASNCELSVSSGGTLYAEGTTGNHITFTKSGSYDWDGVKFPSSSSANNSYLKYCDISYSSLDGINITGQSYSSAFLDLENCVISNCDYGIYVSSSYLGLKNTEIYNCSVKGLYIVSCGAGKVKVDGCSIHNNGGSNGSFTYSGVYVGSSSAPELIGCNIYDNGGSGVYVSGSSPDLNTYYSSSAHANTITSNGTGSQSGSSGCEIYLSTTSYPDINYNNIHDVVSGDNVGALIFKQTSTSETNIVNAQHNYWGADGTVDESDFAWTTTSPTKTFAQVFDISNPEYGINSGGSNWNQAMLYWGAGELDAAAGFLRRAIHDGEAEAINSIHYLSGCTSLQGGDFGELRGCLLGIADTTGNAAVAKTALRFATNCLTEQGNLEAAANEYDDARRNAGTFADSINAVIDYLLVCDQRGIEVNSTNGESLSHVIDRLLALVDAANPGENRNLPTQYNLYEAYPNPFNSVANIRYDLPEAGDVRLGIYDMSGREVAALVQGVQSAGRYQVAWKAGQVPTGLYLCRLEANGVHQTRRLMLLK